MLLEMTLIFLHKIKLDRRHSVKTPRVQSQRSYHHTTVDNKETSGICRIDCHLTVFIAGGGEVAPQKLKQQPQITVQVIRIAPILN